MGAETDRVSVGDKPRAATAELTTGGNGTEDGGEGDSSATGSRLPERLRLLDAQSGMVGRATEVEALRQAWAEARAGGLRVALIGGEPGIGKTRLAAHQARLAEDGGARVLYGRSEAELAIPVQAFAEAFNQYAAELPDEQLGELGARFPALARLVPAIGRLLGGRGPEANPADQHELFYAGSALLAAASRDRPLLLILDDVHWADRPTALMLRHLPSSPEPINALILVTFRTTELEQNASVADALLDLQRQPNVLDIALEGLSPSDALALASDLAGHALAGAELTLAELVHAETGGNPLFMTQLLRNLSEAGTIGNVSGRWSLQRRIEAVDLPGSVTETLRSRVERLGDQVATALAAAAVIGVEFEPELVAEVARLPLPAVEEAIDRAAEAGLVERSGSGPFAFTHALIARVLYDGIGEASRGGAHRRAALAIEELAPGQAAERAPELARHWLEAVPADRDAARRWCSEAGFRALARFEADAAVRWYSRALELGGASGDASHCELLIGLGTAERLSGEAGFRETLLEASRLARALGDRDRLVRSVLANNRGFASASGTVDSERIAAIEMALDAVGEDEHPDRALLLAKLAAELSFSGEWERRVRLSDEALALARRLRDPRTLSNVLIERFVTIWMPATLDERLANSEENVRLADQLGDPQQQYGAVHWHSVALVQAGKVERAVAAIERERDLARRLGDPTALWIATYDDGNLAAIFGRLDQAEDLANEALQIGTASGQPDALPFFGSQLASIRYDQGRLGELQELLAQVVAENPGIPAFRSVLALAYAESGLGEQARELVAMEMASGFDEIPRDVTWLAGHAIYAHVCAELGEREAAEVLYGRIEPYADQLVYTGISAWGDGAHALGRLDATLGRHDEAAAHLEAARARARRIGAPVWAVRTSCDLAALLLDRAAPGDVERAAELLQSATADARRLENPALHLRASNLHSNARARRVIEGGNGAARLRLRHRKPREARADGALSAPAHSSTPIAPDNGGSNGRKAALLRCEGDTWSLTYAGSTLRLRDVKGVRYLASLLAQPGVELHAVDLQSGPAVPADPGALTTPGELAVESTGGDAGAVLDPQAKQQYKQRIGELREEIEEAEGFNDRERAERGREELEFLGRELAAAVGLGGRDRKAASNAERARINVTRAIRKSVQRIAELDTELGDHLERSLRTGSFCVYRPPTSEAVEWQVEAP